ncbi:Josephin-domain-containing protein [Pilobolus umbonatus]|nr:Josephin-domain-containing protein [Pilobolus umbonatus]
MDLVPYIYFERQQQDNLCAQYALNSLLQGQYFNAVDLADIAQQLDRQERVIEGSGRPKVSQNYDDSGYFSIQVIQKALGIWGLDLIPWKSKEMEEARTQPTEQLAYICHLRNHWFTLRKFSKNYRWYNLDSTQPKPTYLSEEYLNTILQQIEDENYSIFVVKGHMNDSKADIKAKELPKPAGVPAPKFHPFTGKGYSLKSSSQVDVEDEDALLAKAIAASLEPQGVKDDMEKIRLKRLERFGGLK